MNNDLPTSLNLNPQMGTVDSAATYPGCPVIARTVQIGGETKAELLARLAQRGVELNESARVLFASDKFITSDVRTHLPTRGLPSGWTVCIIAHCYKLGRVDEEHFA